MVKQRLNYDVLVSASDVQVILGEVGEGIMVSSYLEDNDSGVARHISVEEGDRFRVAD